MFMILITSYNKLVATWGETVAQQTFRIFALHIEPIQNSLDGDPQSLKIQKFYYILS